MVLVLAGDFEYDEAEQLIRQHYGGWEAGYVPPNITPEPPQRGTRRQTVRYPGRTLPVLSINYKAPAWSATDKTAVATEVLGQVAFGPNSAIYRKLVIDEQRVQDLAAGFGLARDPALISINTMVVDPEDVEAVEQEIRSAVNQARETLVDEKMLSDTKSAMKYGFLMGLETAQNIGFAMISYVINTGGIEAVDEYYRTLDAITPEDLREAARSYLVDSSKTVVLMVQEGGE